MAKLLILLRSTTALAALSLLAVSGCTNHTQLASGFGTSTTAASSSTTSTSTTTPTVPTIPIAPAPTPAPITSPTMPVTVNSASSVLVGYGGHIMQTYDSGKTYTQITTSEAGDADDMFNLRAVVHANGIYVATGYRIMTSTDGAHWVTTPSNFPTTNLGTWMQGIAYGLGKWVLVGGCGNRFTSIDNGVTWQENADDYLSGPNNKGCYAFRQVLFGNNIFVASGDSGLLGISNDGLKWTITTPTSTSIDFSSMIFAKGVFYGVSSATSGPNLYRSTDGTTWSLVSSLSATFTAISYTNSKFIVSGPGVIYQSSDAATWTQFTPSNGNFHNAITSLSGGYLTFDWGFTAFSTDLTNWVTTNMTDNFINSASSQ